MSFFFDSLLSGSEGDFNRFLFKRYCASILSIFGLQIRIHQSEHFPLTPAKNLVLANYSNFLDYFCLNRSIKGSNFLCFPENYFDIPVFSGLFRLLNYLPMPIKRPMTVDLHKMIIKVLEQSDNVIVCIPETAGMSLMHPWLQMAAAVQICANCSVIPMAIHGTAASLPPGRWIPVSGNIHLLAGEPLVRPQGSLMHNARRIYGAMRESRENLLKITAGSITPSEWDRFHGR